MGLRQRYGVGLRDVVLDCAVTLTRERGDFTYNQAIACVNRRLREMGVARWDMPKADSIKRMVRKLREEGLLVVVGAIPRRRGEDQLLFQAVITRG